MTVSDSDGQPECFLCCEPGGELVTRVCHCTGTHMHLECQRRMLEAAQAAQGGGYPALRCGVCHARYVNASSRSVWRLSMLGALWCTCCVGVLVMWWSATTVLDRGSFSDPPLSIASPSWWLFW